ncbi:DMT family transporter [Ruminococcus sp. OA3]|uniref:DMT family transporter n=1 Tax=Ruminococcus sp. OA3 TaxID=2914164 RepID=UPI001F0555D7|nr:DMT family transporter [Ruminococcus sp. OA3]MCH1981917.1 DMT family transporter [Ruminococcus sp. OA3]
MASYNVKSQTPQEAYNARKIKMALSGMKIALLLPISAIIQNIFNSSVTDTVSGRLSDKVIISIMISIVLLGIGDIFAGIFTFIYNMVKGKGLKEYKRTASMKVSWMMLLAAAFAGPLATGCWMAATPFCGLTTVAIVTSLGPILTAIFGRFFLHEKLNARIYLGIIIVIAGAIVAGYSGATGAGSNFILGIILAFMAPIGFAAEGQFSTFVGDIIDPNVGCGFFRCFGSGVIGLICMAVLAAATGNIAAYGLIFKIVFTSPMTLLFVAMMGLLGAINYNSAYLAFNRTGPSRTLAIDSSRPVWSIIFGYLFAILGVQDYSVTALAVAGAVIVVVGLFLVIGKPSELVNLRNVE